MSSSCSRLSCIRPGPRGPDYSYSNETVPSLSETPQERSQVRTTMHRYGGQRVQQLSPETFDEFVETHPQNLIAFHAPWCGHCKELEPQFEAAAQSVHTTNPQWSMAAIDCDAHGDFCTKQGVTGYPTIRSYATQPQARFSNKKYQDFDGERTQEGFTRYVKRMGAALKRNQSNDTRRRAQQSFV